MWTAKEYQAEVKRHLGAALVVYRPQTKSRPLSERKRLEIFKGCLDAAKRAFDEKWEPQVASERSRLQQEIAKLKRSKQNQAERELEVAYRAIQQIPVWNRILKTPEAVARFALAVMEEANGTLPRIHIDRIPGFVRWLHNRVQAERSGVVYFSRPFKGRAFDFYGFPHQMPSRERQKYLDAGRQKGLELLSGKTVPRAKKRGTERTDECYRYARLRFLELRSRGRSIEKRVGIVRSEVKRQFKRVWSFETTRKRCMSTKWG